MQLEDHPGDDPKTDGVGHRRVARTAGVTLGIRCDVDWIQPVVDEVVEDADDLDPTSLSLNVRIDAERKPFDTKGWLPLTRGAWHQDGAVVMTDVCTSGFDLKLQLEGDVPNFTFRWRPAGRSRVAFYALRARWHLLARAVLIQYPAMWWAGVRGGVPLHASVCTTGNRTPLLAGPGGVGKTTLLLSELSAGGQAISDNLCVLRDRIAWGLVEPLRAETKGGRKTTHGRREIPMPNRVEALEPDCVVLLRRSSSDVAVTRPCDPERAGRWLAAGTYMAGELRRYWGVAATLSAGAELGPPHPDVAGAARMLTETLPCVEVSLPHERSVRLGSLLKEAVADPPPLGLLATELQDTARRGSG